ncbi:MAG: LysE family translocator [Proteobacteria bacterium]|nr:LysE family translocator [Pseudomonadota bacterium]
METITSFIGILGVLCLGIMSPGPSFVLVARTSVGVSRLDGLSTAIGMGIGGMVFAALTLLGLQAVLLSVPLVYVILKLIGGMYLVYLAITIWGGANQPIELKDHSYRKNTSLFRSFNRGLITQLSNPKTAIYYGSIFAALLPPDLPVSTVLILVPIIFFLEAGWYSLVALVLSSTAPRNVYLDLKSTLDRLASGIIGVLGLKLIFDAKPVSQFME